MITAGDIAHGLSYPRGAWQEFLRTTGGAGSGNFDHAGRPGEVGGSSSDSLPLTRPLIMMGLWTSERDAIVSHDEFSAYLEAHGQEWKAQPLPTDVKRGERKQCFKNASQLAMANPEEYTYVEGLAYAHNTPNEMGFLHAWVVDTAGNVIDTTWDAPEKARYFGVKYEHDAYTAHMLRTKMYGVFGGKPSVARQVLAKGGL